MSLDQEVPLDDAPVLLDRQAEVLELIARAAPLPEVLAEILSSLEHLMPGARCSVLLLDREHRTLHHGAAPSLPQSYVAAIDGMAIGERAGSCGTAASINAAVVAMDVLTDHRWVDFRDIAAAAGVRSCWSTPIEGRDGLPVGTFAVYHQQPHRPTPREQRLVDRFTHLTSVAIDHAGLVADLVESEERFRRSFDDNSLGMAILGPDRTIATSNTALTALCSRELGGARLADVLRPKGRSLDSWLDELSRNRARTVAFEAHVRRADHPDVEVEVTVSLLRSRDGAPAQYVVNVLDLTERRAVEQERRTVERERRARSEAEAARRTAEELSHAKSELLAAVGHEARTPIQAIVGFAELLGTMDLGEDRRREALAHIDAAAGHVMDLLADVLDLSRLEANALPLALEPVRLRDVVEEALAMLAGAASRREVVLGHDLADEVVRVDRRRLRQVFVNLVTNAIRHGSAGGHVRVCTEPAPREGQPQEPRVLVSVVDDGPGIPADLLPRIFTPFARADPGSPTPDARTEAGPPHGTYDESIGLGLGLAHGLMRAMGGDLAVGESGPSGTVMRLVLPAPISLQDNELRP